MDNHVAEARKSFVIREFRGEIAQHAVQAFAPFLDLCDVGDANQMQRIPNRMAFERGRRNRVCNSTRKCAFSATFSGVTVVRSGPQRG